MSAEYGTVETQRDEEAPLLSREIEQNETCAQKWKRLACTHRHHVVRTWALVIAVTAVLTFTYYYAVKQKTPKIPEGFTQDGDLDEQCVSERSWFVALMLSVFVGYLGIDRFYLGYIFLGVLKLVTAGLGGIWWTVDIILIALDVLNDHPQGCHLR